MSKSFQLYLEVHYYNEIHCININGDILCRQKSTHAFNDDFWVCPNKNEVKKTYSGTHSSIHRSESSLKSYTKTADLTKCKMAGCLSSAIDSSEHHIAESRNAINPEMSALATLKVMKLSPC